MVIHQGETLAEVKMRFKREIAGSRRGVSKGTCISLSNILNQLHITFLLLYLVRNMLQTEIIC